MKVTPSPTHPDGDERPFLSGKSFLYHCIVSAFVFLLFLEWLRPLTAMADITDIHRINPFIWAVATYLFFDALRVPGWLGWPLKVGITAGWIGYWFRPEAFFSGSWWFDIAAIASADFQSMINGQYLSLSPELRTFVFLLGWAALVYAVVRIVADRGQGVWFVGATIGFLLLLQLWPGIDTNAGIMRAASWGLIMLSVLNVPKWERASGFAFAGGKRSAAAVATAGVVLGSAVLGGGYALSASLPKDVTAVEVGEVVAWAQEFGAGSVSVSYEAKSGYDTFDGNLGAPVTKDDSVAFVARSSKPAYWRGESKDIYTGRGWRKSAQTDGSKVFQSDYQNAGNLPSALQEVEVVDERLSRTVFTGGPVLRFAQLTSRSGERVSDVHIRHDGETGAYFVGTNTVKLASYALEASVASHDEEKLLLDNGTVPADVSRRNLQLPDGLPVRVKELAQSIVKELPSNRLMYALAVQKYLHDHYTYTLDTELPPRGADFVDTFLFERREGYCNHFSTAMVVMLRSLGIESRWVKGFAPGTPEGGSGDAYVIRGKDAHSWVEVYFPEAGWVPFEATPGFGYAANSGSNASLTAEHAKAVNMIVPPHPFMAEGTVSNGNVTPKVEAAAAGGLLDSSREFIDSFINEAIGKWEETKTRLAQLKQMYDAAAAEDGRIPKALVGLAVVGGLAAVAPLVVRRFPSPSRRRSVARNVRRRDPAAEAAMMRLDAFWKRIYRRYGARADACTLREYVACLPAESRNVLFELVKYDESVRFGGDPGRRATRRWLDDVWRRVSS